MGRVPYAILVLVASFAPKNSCTKIDHQPGSFVCRESGVYE